MSNLLHSFNSTAIAQRSEDGYIDATAMCKANRKQFNDYYRLGATEAFLVALSTETGIPVSELVAIKKGGDVRIQGTWVHPHVAINLAQWCSPQFAVFVSKLVFNWMTGNTPQSPVQPDKSPRIQELELEVRLAEINLETLRLTMGSQRASTHSQRQPTSTPAVTINQNVDRATDRVLSAVNEEPATAKEIALRANVQYSTARRSLWELAKQGKISRKRGPSNTRWAIYYWQHL